MLSSSQLTLGPGSRLFGGCDSFRNLMKGRAWFQVVEETPLLRQVLGLRDKLRHVHHVLDFIHPSLLHPFYLCSSLVSNRCKALQRSIDAAELLEGGDVLHGKLCFNGRLQA